MSIEIATRGAAPPRPTARLLLVSGLLGFLIGVDFANWQVVVETAQVVAGLVQYPPDNPFYVYHTKLWTGLHQIGAVMLLSGMSEITLSIIMSGLLGVMIFQGWALCVYALSRDALLAIGAAFVIFLSRAAEYGVVYPVSSVGTTHTYGVVGQSLFMLVAGMVGIGWYRTGAFLLGVAPALHPSLGGWLVLIAAIALLWDVRHLRTDLRPALPAFLVACGLTALSLMIHLAASQDAPYVDSEIAARYLDQFVTFWDGHRQPVDFGRAGVKMNGGALVLAVIWLRFFANDLPRAAISLLRLIVVSAVLGLILALASWMPPDRVPAQFLILMPSRVLNFAVVVFVALLFGLLGAYPDRWWSPVVTLLLSLGLVLAEPSSLWSWLQQQGHAAPDDRIEAALVMGIAGGALVIGAAADAWRRRRSSSAATQAPGLARTARLASLLVLGASCVLSFDLARRYGAFERGAIFFDRTNDALFADAARSSGLLLTGGDLHLIQLRTRRPVLLDGGGLDALPYALEAAPAMDRILRDVYGVDLFNPPAEARGSGLVPVTLNKLTWERYSRQQWRKIKRQYGVSRVLAYPDWLLDLPPIAQNRRFILYEIPD